MGAGGRYGWGRRFGIEGVEVVRVGVLVVCCKWRFDGIYH